MTIIIVKTVLSAEAITVGLDYAAAYTQLLEGDEFGKFVAYIEPRAGVQDDFGGERKEHTQVCQSDDDNSLVDSQQQ